MEAAIFDDLTALADATRSRMLLLLERHELTVGELCAVLQLPQSTVSRHLKTLADASWVVVAPRRHQPLLHAGARRTRRAVAPALVAAARAGPRDAGADQDARRLKTVLTTRQTKSQEFFECAAAQWDKLREDLFGRGVAPAGAAGAARSQAGSSAISAAAPGSSPRRLPPFVARVIAVDRSGEMLQAAGAGCARCRTSRFASGELEALPIETASSTPRRCSSCCTICRIRPRRLREAARVLKPGGRLLIADMLPHDREEYRQQMGHVWLGFGEEQMQQMLAAAGFEAVRIVPLAADADAKGPALFVASGERKKA